MVSFGSVNSVLAFFPRLSVSPAQSVALPSKLLPAMLSPASCASHCRSKLQSQQSLQKNQFWRNFCLSSQVLWHIIMAYGVFWLKVSCIPKDSKTRRLRTSSEVTVSSGSEHAVSPTAVLLVAEISRERWVSLQRPAAKRSFSSWGKNNNSEVSQSKTNQNNRKLHFPPA